MLGKLVKGIILTGMEFDLPIKILILVKYLFNVTLFKVLFLYLLFLYVYVDMNLFYYLFIPYITIQS